MNICWFWDRIAFSLFLFLHPYLVPVSLCIYLYLLYMTDLYCLKKATKILLCFLS